MVKNWKAYFKKYEHTIFTPFFFLEGYELSIWYVYIFYRYLRTIIIIILYNYNVSVYHYNCYYS